MTSARCSTPPVVVPRPPSRRRTASPTCRAFGTWGGDAAAAATDAIDRTRKDLDAHGNEALAVAQLAKRAADDIEDVKAQLVQLRADAERLGMSVDPVGNTIEPSPGSAGAPPIEVELKRAQLQPRLDAILTEAARIDEDLARAIRTAIGETPIPDTPHDNRPEIQDALSEPVPDDPDRFNDLWERLTREEKDWLYAQDHAIGNHPGMPFVDRDRYNRMHLDELARATQSEIDRLRNEHPDWAAGAVPNPRTDGRAYSAWREWRQDWHAAQRRLDGYRAVETVLHRNDGVPRFLGSIDDRGTPPSRSETPTPQRTPRSWFPGPVRIWPHSRAVTASRSACTRRRSTPTPPWSRRTLRRRRGWATTDR